MKNRHFLIGVKNAVKGLWLALKTEKNFIVYGVHAAVTLTVNLLLGLSPTQHLLWFVCVCGVFSAECVNTAVERICNFLTEEYDGRIRDIKDIAAAAVCCFGVAFYVVELTMIGLRLFA